MTANTTNFHDHVPLHWMNRAQTMLWLLAGEPRRQIAAELCKRYPAGVGVVTKTMRLIAYVDPRGGVRELPPPHRLFKMHEMANRPAVAECPCADYYDPEVAGPWRHRQTTDHHPLCEFDQLSEAVFDFARKNPHVRPDHWLQIRNALRG